MRYLDFCTFRKDRRRIFPLAVFACILESHVISQYSSDLKKPTPVPHEHEVISPYWNNNFYANLRNRDAALFCPLSSQRIAPQRLITRITIRYYAVS
jgi:hypothetical protein